jgi:hypothetical protein
MLASEVAGRQVNDGRWLLGGTKRALALRHM